MKHNFLITAVAMLAVLIINLNSHSATKTSIDQLTLKRTDAIFRNATFATFVKAISDDGKQILTFNGSPAASDVSALELFDNVNGKLVTKATLPMDPAYPNIDDCFVDESFSIFGIMDDNSGSPVAKARIRTLKLVGNTFQTVNEVIFNDATFDELNANISLDGKYIMTNYTTPSTNPNLISNIKLLETKTLSTLTSFKINGISNGPHPFVLTKKGKKTDYFVFGYGAFTQSFQSVAPAFLAVYKIADNKLKLVDQVELTAFPLTFLANNAKESTRIITGLNLDQTKNSVFNYSTVNIPFIPNKTNNVLQYKFDGKKLQLDSSMQVDLGPLVSNYYKDGKTFGVGQWASDTETLPTNVCFYSFYTQNPKSKSLNKFRPVLGTFATGTRPFFGLFSRNGKYFAVGGAPTYTDATPSNPNGINSA